MDCPCPYCGQNLLSFEENSWHLNQFTSSNYKISVGGETQICAQIIFAKNLGLAYILPKKHGRTRTIQCICHTATHSTCILITKEGCCKRFNVSCTLTTSLRVANTNDFILQPSKGEKKVAQFVRSGQEVLSEARNEVLFCQMIRSDAKQGRERKGCEVRLCKDYR